MKKIYLLLVVAATLLSVSNVSAQNIKFGAKAGLNISTFYGKDANENSKAGIYIGGFLENKISDKVSLQGELLYTQLGAIDNDNSDMKIKLDYITIPLMCKYYVSEKVNIQFGPQLGFNVNSEITDGDNTVSFKDVIGEDAETFEFGLNFGAEVFFTQNFGLNARYNLGLTEFIKDLKSKNAAIQLGLAYRF